MLTGGLAAMVKAVSIIYCTKLKDVLKNKNQLRGIGIGRFC
jgi:thioredoxin-related protein